MAVLCSEFFLMLYFMKMKYARVHFAESQNLRAAVHIKVYLNHDYQAQHSLLHLSFWYYLYITTLLFCFAMHKIAFFQWQLLLKLLLSVGILKRWARASMNFWHNVFSRPNTQNVSEPPKHTATWDYVETREIECL